MADYQAQCSSNKYITLLLRTQVAGQDVAGNTTTLTWSLHVLKSGASTSATWGNCSYDATINGQGYSGSGQVRVEAGGDTVILSGTTVIPHNADGTKSVSLSASISGKIVGSLSTSEALPTIPRASSLSFGTGTMGSPMTLTINAASSSFTHSLTYQFGSASGTILSYVGAGAHSWTPPLSLTNQIPNATAGVGTLTLYTWAGVGVSVGVTSYSLTLSLPSSVAPSISSVTASEATSGLAAQFGAYVQGKSTLKVVTSAAGSYGSTIKSCTVSFDGKSYSGTNITTSAPSKSGSLTITAKVTDSRGRTASRSITVSVQPYASPAITALRVWRCDVNGNADDSGDYAGISYAYSIASVNAKNTKSATIQYKRSTGSNWATLASNSAYSANTTIHPATELLSDYQWDIRLTVSDYFGSTSMTATLPSAEVLLDLLSSGNGMGIGKTAEQANLLDIEWPVRIGSKVTLRTDGEGGNVRLDAPDQYNRHWEMDAYNGNLRIYTQTNDNQNYHALTIATNGDLSTDGAIAANGNISCGGALTGQYGYLSTLTLGGNLVADYIIAQGTSGIWIYRKWASGVVECWGTARPSYANSNVLIVRVNLPFTFSSIAAILGALNDTGANAQAALDWNTKVQARNDNNTLDVVIHSYTGPFANGSVASVSLHVLGRA